MSTTTAEAGTSGLFLNTLAPISGGRTLAKLESALREATRAALESGLKAKISLELTIAPNGVGVGEVPLLKVTGKVRRVLPEKPETGAVFFADADNNLTRRNPNQEELKLEVRDGGKPNAAAKPVVRTSDAAGR